MAKILMLAFDTYGPDDEADRFAWKIGHIIDVKPDTHTWGASEGLPKFWRINLPGISVDQVKKFLAYKFDYTNVGDPIQIGIREWKLDANSLPVATLNTLKNTGEITVTKLNSFSGYMKLV